MLGGTLLHAKSLNRHVVFVGYSDDGIYCKEVITRYYPSMVTVMQGDQAPRDATLVSEVIKLMPNINGQLVPVAMSTYRNGIDMETVERIWRLDVKHGRWQEMSRYPNSFYKLNEQQEIVLQVIIQGCDAKGITQTLHAYGYYSKRKLIKTHVGGYICENGTLIDYLVSLSRSSSQAEMTDDQPFQIVE